MMRKMLEILETFNIYPVVLFMLRGLGCKWKQSVDYFVTSSTPSSDLLKHLLLKCIKIASKCGLIVKAIICDQGSNNQSMVRKLGASVSKSYFVHDNNRIIIFYDPSHLLKNVINNLNKSGLKVGENNVLWQHFVSFNCSDSLLLIIMAPKLTQKHVDLPVF